MAGEHIKHLTDEGFEATIETGLTLVDFFADWCGPCRMLAPVFEEVSDELHEAVTFGKLDIDKNSGAATKYQVTSVPTLILFKDGEEVYRKVGLADAGTIKEFIAATI